MSLIIYEIVKKIYIRTIDSPLVLSAETANRKCIEVSEANSIDVANVRHGTFPYSVICPNTLILRVLPEFAHQDFRDLTNSSKQALEKKIS